MGSSDRLILLTIRKILNIITSKSRITDLCSVQRRIREFQELHTYTFT